MGSRFFVGRREAVKQLWRFATDTEAVELSGRVLALLTSNAAGCRMIVYCAQRRCRLAVIEGSPSYALLALFALGLAPSVPAFAKDRDRAGVAFVGGEPANGGA